MARRKVIARWLVAVEALGSCTFIASDKTGTLTMNELTARKVLLPGGLTRDVTGQGIEPDGEIAAPDMARPLLERVCTAAMVGADIRSRLDWDPLVRTAPVEVAVSNGRVALKGRVGGPAELPSMSSFGDLGGGPRWRPRRGPR